MSSILVFVAAVIVLAAGDCIKDIEEFEKNKKENKTFVGEYVPIKDPEKDAVVRKIVADTIEFYNKYAEDMFLYKDDDHYVAYRQLVKGENYCCSYHMISNGCKSGRNDDICKTKQKMICSINAHKELTETYASIHNQPYCTLLLPPNTA